MIGGLKKIKVLPGKEVEFENIFNQLRVQVKKNEFGNQYYDLYKSKTDSGIYIVMERYVDENALQNHKRSTDNEIYFQKIKALLEHLEVEYFEAVEG